MPAENGSKKAPEPTPDFSSVTEVEIATYRSPICSCRNSTRGCPPGMVLDWKVLGPGEALPDGNGNSLAIFTKLGGELLLSGDLEVRRRIWRAHTCAHANFKRRWGKELAAWMKEQKEKEALAERAQEAGLVLPERQIVSGRGSGGLVGPDGKSVLR
jgi:hypothetical protein